MAERAVVHVGLPKTGTTYLQSVMWANYEALKQQCLLVPGFGPRQHMWASLVIREHPGVAKRRPEVATAWADLVAQVREWPGTALISHEFLAAATEEQAGRAVADLGCEVEIVVTARDLLTITSSYWQEYIKHGFDADLDAFPPQVPAWDEWGAPTLDIASVVRRWGAHVPAERVHVVVVPGRDAPRDTLLHRFAEVLGVDAGGFTVERARENGSLGVVEAELLRRITRRTSGFTSAIDRGVWLRTYLSQDTLVPRGGDRFLPSTARIAALRAQADEAVAFLAASGVRVHGNLEALRVGAEPTGLRHPDDVREDELLDASLDVLVSLLEDVRRFRRENTALRKELAPPPEAPSLASRVRRRLRSE